MTMPDWLITHLDNQGILDAPTRLTHRAQPRGCPANCGLYVLAGLDDNMGWPIYADPFPTTPAGELIALLRGLRTYALIAGELIHRDVSSINHQSADQIQVHTEHDCSMPWLPVNSKFAPKPKPVPIYDEPPF